MSLRLTLLLFKPTGILFMDFKLKYTNYELVNINNCRLI